MPLQNRIDPWGRFFRTSARGLFMGNRGGVLHRTRRAKSFVSTRGDVGLPVLLSSRAGPAR